MAAYHHHIRHEDLTRTLRALVKFCRDHDHTALTSLQGILDALEQGDFETASRRYQSLPSGPWCWDDWFPPVVYDHEDGDFVWTVFQALVERWHRMMRTAIGIK